MRTAQRRDILRIATAGSVDDGKSTLIGRLLYDSKTVLADQLAAVEQASRRRGARAVDLALLTDGLREERQQGITIDVAYRYFATPTRSFVLADTPGHFEYTRNMITGASTADLAVVLVDARRGLTEQSKRHAYLAGLLRVPRVVLAVNKMDLVGFDQDVFQRVAAEFRNFADDPFAIPVSALHGDNVVEKSARTPWYDGPPLLQYLESVSLEDSGDRASLRFPVQYVIRPRSATHPDYRGYAGRVANGTLRAGSEVMHLPSGVTTTVVGIDTAAGGLTVARSGQSVAVRLADDIEVSRGDMLCSPAPVARRTTVEALACCLDPRSSLRPGQTFLLKHTTRTVRCQVEAVTYRVDVGTLDHQETEALGLNEIGAVRLSLADPIFADTYAASRETGGFILVNPATNATTAAGMIQ